jgi:hypothetical protein
MPKRDAEVDRYRALEQHHSRFLALDGVHSLMGCLCTCLRVRKSHTHQHMATESELTPTPREREL